MDRNFSSIRIRVGGRGEKLSEDWRMLQRAHFNQTARAKPVKHATAAGKTDGILLSVNGELRAIERPAL